MASCWIVKQFNIIKQNTILKLWNKFEQGVNLEWRLWFIRQFAESATMMSGLTSKAMSNLYEAEQDDIERKIAVPKLSLKTI